VIAPSTTVCNAGSGDLCDPDESCTGVADAGCPADTIAPATTICRNGSGDICDPAESCTGVADAGCPGNAVAPLTTTCRTSTSPCDPVESCTGTPGSTCPADVGGPEGCNSLTNTEFCPLPSNEFRLIYIQDPYTSSGSLVTNNYRLNSSNPGQFYYNVFHTGSSGSSVSLDIELPYPFVTQGAVPIQVHDMVGDSNGCFVPSPSITSQYTITCDGGNISTSGNAVVLLGDYGPTSGQDVGSLTTMCHVSGTVPSTGLVYVTIHLNYGLKTSTSWNKDAAISGPMLNAANNVGTSTGEGDTILDHQPYLFRYDGSSSSMTEPTSTNAFKKNPGGAGLTLRALDSSPVSGVTVQLIAPTGKVVGTGVTDTDGFYQILYKHKGKPADYTVRVPAYNLQQTARLKSNGYIIVVFDTLP